MFSRFASLAFSIAVVPALLGESVPDRPQETSVQRLVREAKAKGLTRIERSLIVDYPVVRSIDSAAQYYEFVIAVPTQMLTHLDEVDATVRTVYKLRLERFVLQQPDRSTNMPFRRPKRPTDSFEIPPDLLPWESNEFLISTFGGAATVDGIEFISVSASEPRFELGETYLLVVNFADTEDRIAGLPMSGHCVWRIQGDELIPLIPTSRNPLARDVVAFFRGSLRRLEFALPLPSRKMAK